MVFGDSTATGYGCRDTDEVPGALIARGLAATTGGPVRLSTKAIVGATSKGLASQVDAVLVAGPPPDAAVIMIGANDVTTLNGIGPSARRLGLAVRRLRAAIPQSSSEPARTSAGSPPFHSHCAGPPARSACGWPRPRPPRPGRRWPARPAGQPAHTALPERARTAVLRRQLSPVGRGYALAAGQLLAALRHALGLPAPESPWTPLRGRPRGNTARSAKQIAAPPEPRGTGTRGGLGGLGFSGVRRPTRESVMPEAVIVSTARSPIGRAGKGSLVTMRPDDLATQMVRAALTRSRRSTP